MDIDWHEFEARFGDTDFLVVKGPVCMNEAEEGAIPENDHWCLNPCSVDAICAHLPHLRWVNVRDNIIVPCLDYECLAVAAERYLHQVDH